MGKAQNASMADLLARHGQGNAQAQERVVAAVYSELRTAAHRQTSESGALVPVALVDQVYRKLVAEGAMKDRDRTAFFAVAASAMRWVVHDHARKENAGLRAVLLASLDEDEATAESADVARLDQALERLAREMPRIAKVVELRLLTGLDVEDAATALAVSESDVRRDEAFGRRWLARELDESDPSLLRLRR